MDKKTFKTFLIGAGTILVLVLFAGGMLLKLQITRAQEHIAELNLQVSVLELHTTEVALQAEQTRWRSDSLAHQIELEKMK